MAQQRLRAGWGASRWPGKGTAFARINKVLVQPLHQNRCPNFGFTFGQWLDQNWWTKCGDKLSMEMSEALPSSDFVLHFFLLLKKHPKQQEPNKTLKAVQRTKITPRQLSLAKDEISDGKFTPNINIFSHEILLMHLLVHKTSGKFKAALEKFSLV